MSLRCVIDSFGCLPFRWHFARATAIPSFVRMLIRVALKLGNHREHIEQQLPDRVGGVVPAATETERDAFRRQFIGDVPCVPHRPSEPIEFRDNEGVAFPNGGERFAEARSGPVCAGQSVIDVDVRIEDPESQQRVTLRGEILIGGGDSGMANLNSIHAAERPTMIAPQFCWIPLRARQLYAFPSPRPDCDLAPALNRGVAA